MEKMPKIGGKNPAKNLKMKAWRLCADYMPYSDGKINLDNALELIACVYGTTPDFIEENVDLQDIIPVSLNCIEYVKEQIFVKLEALPKKKETEQD